MIIREMHPITLKDCLTFKSEQHHSEAINSMFNKIESYDITKDNKHGEIVIILS